MLLRSDLLPLGIDRDLRLEYIKGLEMADAGDLSPLASIIARLERAAIMQALSVDADAEISHQRTLTSAVIESLAQKFGRRRETKHAELRKVNGLALALRARARKALEQSFNQLKHPVSAVAEPEIHIADGGPDRGNAHWYKFEVVKSANGIGKFANFTEDHYFVKASMRVERERLIFVVSFHHVGRELSGIMEATAFANLSLMRIQMIGSTRRRISSSVRSNPSSSRTRRRSKRSLNPLLGGLMRHSRLHSRSMATGSRL